MRTKRFFSAYMVFSVLLLHLSWAFSEGLLPDLNDVYGVTVPSFTDVIERHPEILEETDEGTKSIYQDITDDDYYRYGAVLQEAGCEVANYSVDGSVITVTIACKGKPFFFSYDIVKSTMTLLYPKGIHDEPKTKDTSERALKALFLKGEELLKSGDYDAAIQVFADLGDYSGSPEMVKECHYQKANQMLALGQYKEAYLEFRSIGNYKDSAEKITTEEFLSALKQINYQDMHQVGSIVIFGRYEQDNNSDNGSEDIEWIVLDVQGDQALLISKYGLDAAPYNQERDDTTWEKCSLRKWLNGDFLKTAFSTSEQKTIIKTSVDNGPAQGNSSWKTSGGKNTKDHLFLLSYQEAEKYFKGNEARRCAPTVYAKGQGAWTSTSNKTMAGEAAGWWWLRSPGFYQYIAALVDHDGLLDFDDVDNDSAFIRPAFWINLKSDIFQSE